MSRFEAGQRWIYRRREQDPDSTLVIGRVQTSLVGPSVVHISVQRVLPPGAVERVDVCHLPLALEALEASVEEVLESGVKIGELFEQGLAQWESEEGGVFDAPLKEVLDHILTVQPPKAEDPFDSLVLEMRATESEPLIIELYKRLFALNEWVFLCEPGNEKAPVTWIFPKGANPKPALLAFTNRELAAQAAVALKINDAGEPVSMMPVPVRTAVEWVSGKDCSTTWICFNLTRESFPLYCESAAKNFQQFGPR